MTHGASVTLPSEPAPTGEDWLPISLDGRWYWDGHGWRRTVESPWPASRVQRGWRANVASMVLITPTVFLLSLLAQVVGRALAAAVRVVVGVFALGAVVAMLILLTAALLHF